MRTDIGIEVIWEADGIARAIGRTRRQVNHMLATGSLPGAVKIAGRWCITRAALQAVFSSTTKEAA